MCLIYYLNRGKDENRYGSIYGVVYLENFRESFCKFMSLFDNNVYFKILIEINNKLFFYFYVIYMYNLYVCNVINLVKVSYEKYLLL